MSDSGGTRTAVTVVAVILTIGALWWAQVILIPLVLGVLSSYALDPLQRRLTAWGVPRLLAAAVILVAIAAGAGASALGIRHQASAFVAELPRASEQIRRVIRDGRASSDKAMAQVQQAAAELKSAADGSSDSAPRGVTRVQVEDPGLRLADLLWRGSIGAVALAAQAAIVISLAFYLLASGDLYKRKMVRLAGPSLAKRRITVEILNHITREIERFLLARLLVSLMVGVATALAFRALGVAEPAMWGLGAGVLNTIPYVGPCVVAAAAALAGFVQFGTIGMAAVLAGVSVAIATVEGMLVMPWFIGRANRMSAGAVFVGLSFWGWIWGTWGMLLAVPILICVKAVCEQVEDWRPISELLGD